jgi:hypothetical protein
MMMTTGLSEHIARSFRQRYRVVASEKDRGYTCVDERR